MAGISASGGSPMGRARSSGHRWEAGVIGLDVVVAMCVLVNAAGLVAAAFMVYRPRGNLAGPRSLSFAIGVLLGAVLVDLLPHLWEATGNLAALGGVIAAAVLASWLFDGACSCSRQVSGHASAAHDHTRSRGAVRSGGPQVVLVGDFVHSLADGALIVAALAAGVVPGAVATMAVAMHEVPRRMAIVAIQVHAGRPPLLALALTLCAGMGTVIGGMLAWWSAKAIEQALPFALALAAAALLYIVLVQSAQAVHAWRSRVFTLELGLPFLSGIFVVGVSHRVLEMLG